MLDKRCVLKDNPNQHLHQKCCKETNEAINRFFYWKFQVYNDLGFYSKSFHHYNFILIIYFFPHHFNILSGFKRLYFHFFKKKGTSVEKLTNASQYIFCIKRLYFAFFFLSTKISQCYDRHVIQFFPIHTFLIITRNIYHTYGRYNVVGIPIKKRQIHCYTIISNRIPHTKRRNNKIMVIIMLRA